MQLHQMLGAVYSSEVTEKNQRNRLRVDLSSTFVPSVAGKLKLGATWPTRGRRSTGWLLIA
ncbi:MAG: hypothetical protein DLM69_01315 [Candidatus Chloroheliales bacterium]|nr:MAG: hypothetical protein DLM69_01315 [Chloroflexota bacterium]